MRIPAVEGLLAARAGQVVQTTVDISNATTQPSSAALLNQNLASFSIEMDHWPAWAGSAVGSPNTYANQLFQNLADRTGKGVFLRVGANSEDKSLLNLSMPVGQQGNQATPVAAVIGRDWYRLSGNLPDGTQFMWGINLKVNNLTETTDQAQLLGETFQGDNAVTNVDFVNLELGNEPDFYGWASATWAQRWQAAAQGALSVINMALPGPSFVGGSWYSGGQYNNGYNCRTVLYNYALYSKYPAIGAAANTFSEHAYSGAYNGNPSSYHPGCLMSKAGVRGNVSVRTGDRATVAEYGLKYILSETNSYSSLGVPGVSNTFESAVWAVDYLLQNAIKGVQRCHLHNGVGFRYNQIQPVAANDGTGISGAHINPSYYAFVIVNEAIGTSGNSYVTELSSPSDITASYGIYENNKLVRIIITNSATWLSGTRPTTQVTINGWTSGMRGTLKRLSGGATNSFSGLTWAGQSFETSNGVPSGSVTTEAVTNGVVSLPATSVIMIELTQ